MLIISIIHENNSYKKKKNNHYSITNNHINHQSIKKKLFLEILFIYLFCLFVGKYLFIVDIYIYIYIYILYALLCFIIYFILILIILIISYIDCCYRYNVTWGIWINNNKLYKSCKICPIIIANSINIDQYFFFI